MIFLIKFKNKNVFAVYNLSYLDNDRIYSVTQTRVGRALSEKILKPKILLNL